MRGRVRLRLSIAWLLAAALSSMVAVWDAAWVVVDGRSLLVGDVTPVVWVLVLLWGPVVGTCVGAARWPRTGGVALAWVWVPWGLWFTAPYLLDGALWLWLPLALGMVWTGGRWPGGWVPGAVAVGVALAGVPYEGRELLAAQGGVDSCPRGVPAGGGGVEHIVLITLDTVRADHLGVIGGSRFQVPTPHLDGLAKQGTLFTEGVAPAPLTAPAHVSLLTGCDPLELGVTRNGVALPPGVDGVARQLQARGYRTGAFIGANVLERRMGLDRGFDHYDDRFDAWHRLGGTWPRRLLDRLGVAPMPRERNGSEVVARAIRWLEESSRPTFLWVHLYDAHHPYDPDPAALEDLVDTAPEDGTGTPADTKWWWSWAREYEGRPPLWRPGPQGDATEIVRAYAGEVAEVDGLVGRLLSVLPDDAAVLVAADHGESLTEHAYAFNHGAHAYQVTVRVPFLVRGPGFQRVERREEPVSGRGVAGTLLRWGGLQAKGLGSSDEGALESFAAGQEARRHLRLLRGGAELAVREGPVKYLVRPDEVWRFDLAVDPEERNPESVERPDLQRRLEELAGGARGEIKGLEELGYVE